MNSFQSRPPRCLKFEGSVHQIKRLGAQLRCSRKGTAYPARDNDGMDRAPAKLKTWVEALQRTCEGGVAERLPLQVENHIST